jgi:transposase
MEIAQVDGLIAADALGWPEIKRLMTVPGVNVTVAATFMAAVGDIRRFADRRKLTALDRAVAPRHGTPHQPSCRRSGATPDRAPR